MQLATSIPPVVEWTSFHFEYLRTEERDKFSGRCETQTHTSITYMSYTTLSLPLSLPSFSSLLLCLRLSLSPCAPVHLCIFMLFNLSVDHLLQLSLQVQLYKRKQHLDRLQQRNIDFSVLCAQGLLEIPQTPSMSHPTYILAIPRPWREPHHVWAPLKCFPSSHTH